MDSSVSQRCLKITLIIIGIILLCGKAFAQSNCTCRYAGQSFGLDTCVCIDTPAGPRLACCGMVLNNTSWTFTENACPVAGLPDDSPAPERLAQSLPPDARWPETLPSNHQTR